MQEKQNISLQASRISVVSHSQSLLHLIEAIKSACERWRAANCRVVTTKLVNFA